MFGEPLMDLFRDGTHRLDSRLCEIRDHLAGIVGNTEASLSLSQWNRKSVGIEAETEQLRNTDAYAWLVRDVATTQPVEVFVNAADDTGFMAKLAAGERDNVHWYVPPGSVIFVKPTGEKAGSTNFNIELLNVTPRAADTGTSTEHSTHAARVPPLPSGHPEGERAIA